MKDSRYYLAAWFSILLWGYGCEEVSRTLGLSRSAGDRPEVVEVEKSTPGIPDSSTVKEELTGLPIGNETGEQVPLDSLPDTAFVRLADYSEDFSFDLKYAGEQNFLKKAVYECGECYVRANTARALLAANAEFLTREYHIHFFDCYRPQSVQELMWEILPDPHYVANPRRGSIHSRGGAVDIGLADGSGNLLDMGTPFDYFGEEAHHAYPDHSPEVQENRLLLRTVMERHGFWTIRTEWWHYNLQAASAFPLTDFRWDCPAEDAY